MQGRAKKVALSVDANDAELDRIVEALKPDMLQLHGKETPERVAAVRTRFGLPVMKALPIETRSRSRADPALRQGRRLAAVRRAARRARRRGPAGSARPSTGRLLENLDPGVPFMLSGGLDAGNVAEALRITRAPAVDVSSGVERAPGEKDPDKIRAFIRAARAADDAAAAKVASTTHDRRSSPIRSAPGPTSAGISASMAAASSPRR